MRDVWQLPLRILSGLYILCTWSAGAGAASASQPELHLRRAVAPSTTRLCSDWAHKIPTITVAACMAADLQAAPQRTVQGRSIYTRDVISPDARVRVLVVGAMHGDELSSSALALQWIAQAQDTGSNVQWRFIPMLNPDGVFAKPSRRTNANGVDLNRNFPTPNWKREAAYYWEQRTRRDPRRWPGPQPLSEPESRYLNAQMRAFKPHLIVSIHAPYGLLDYDGPSTPPPKLGRLYLDQVGIFPGSLGNFGGIQQGMPVVTIELPSATHAPGEAETRQMWIDLLRWIAQHIKV